MKKPLNPMISIALLTIAHGCFAAKNLTTENSLAQIEVNESGINIDNIIKIQAPKRSSQKGHSTEPSNNKIFRNDDFVGVNFSGQSFVGAHFINTDFTHADLSDVDFTGATFKNVEFTHSNLQGTCFNNAVLINTDFNIGTDATGAIMTGAQLINNDYNGANVSQIIWSGPQKCPHNPANDSESSNASKNIH